MRVFEKNKIFDFHTAEEIIIKNFEKAKHFWFFYNLKKLGNAILYSSLIEIKKFIKQSDIKKT